MSLTTIENNALTFSEREMEFIKNYYCKSCNDDEVTHFFHVCLVTGLDPRLKQIHPIIRGAGDRRKMSIQTAIDGYRLIAERTKKYSPGRQPTFTYNELGALKSATAYVKKMTHDGTWHEVCATAFWDEYAVYYNGNPADFWKRMPHNQLAKCAEALALRKAFPAQLSALLTDDEMDQARNREDSQMI